MMRNADLSDVDADWPVAAPTTQPARTALRTQNLWILATILISNISSRQTSDHRQTIPRYAYLPQRHTGKNSPLNFLSSHTNYIATCFEQ